MTTANLFALPRTTKADAFFGQILPAVPLQLPDASVSHALVYTVEGPGGGTWSVRLQAGALQIASGTPWPIATQTVISGAHFREVVAGAVRDRLLQVLKKLGRPQDVPDLRGLPVEPKQVAALAAVQGSLRIVLRDRELDDSYQLTILFGSTPPPAGQPTCTLEVELDDAAGLLAARTPPLQWFTTGKFRMQGDTSLPVRALGALLAA